MCYFRQYRDFFGVPNTGVHKFKILDTAMVEYGLTIAVAFLWSYFTGFPLELSTILWFALGVLSHALFCVDTNAIKYIQKKLK